MILACNYCLNQIVLLPDDGYWLSYSYLPNIVSFQKGWLIWAFLAVSTQVLGFSWCRDTTLSCFHFYLTNFVLLPCWLVILCLIAKQQSAPALSPGSFSCVCSFFSDHIHPKLFWTMYLVIMLKLSSLGLTFLCSRSPYPLSLSHVQFSFVWTSQVWHGQTVDTYSSNLSSRTFRLSDIGTTHPEAQAKQPEVILSFFISLNPSQRQVSLANSPPAPSDHRLTNSTAITSVEAPSSFMSPPT